MLRVKIFQLGGGVGVLLPAASVISNGGLPSLVEGGAIAHGHPIGATGTVLTTRILHAMERDGVKRGLVTLCIGGGQGIALALERMHS